MSDALATVLDYHQRTKHHPGRYARSLGYLDWATQPDPFRRYDGAPRVELGEVPVGAEPAGVRDFNHAFISQLFYDSLALSAWKNFRGSRWSLRVNPSSGNLHPTEGYLVSHDGVFHYHVFEHALEKRADLEPAGGNRSAWVGLTSIYWRQAWKYGERAFRYCMHDVGHAIAAVMMAGRVMGWNATLPEVADDRIAALLGITDQSGPEAEHADCLLALSPGEEEVLLPAPRGPWLGTPNALSAEHHDWPVIGEVARATVNTGATASVGVSPHPIPLPGGEAIRRLIRQRRSAVAMDGRTFITAEQFRGMMRQASAHPLPWRPCVHLAVFVHRVHDMTPGLYVLVRDTAQLEALRGTMKRDFPWRDVGEGLFLLHEADCRRAAGTICCHQEIAADGCFALGMIARFEPVLREQGPWMYRRLFWETGLIGQVLYLGAEAAGVRATGIGCFFDDLMHEVLGLRDRRYQSLYHFTVGGAVDDPRLETEPAYAHLRRRR